jgi:hypothetical protein
MCTDSEETVVAMVDAILGSGLLVGCVTKTRRLKEKYHSMKTFYDYRWNNSERRYLHYPYFKGKYERESICELNAFTYE